MSAPRTLRIGVAGLGRAGAAMLAAMVQHPLVRVTAAADPRPEPRDRFEAELGGETYASVEEMCASPNVDVVYVATPHQFHMEHVVAAANAGKHIICEKPIALSLVECDAMIEAVERNRVQIVIGHTHSHDPAVRVMRRMIVSGEYGRVGMINNWVFTDFLYRPRRPEELDTTRGGGILFNQVPHQVDVARHLGGGRVRSVRAMTGVWDAGRPTEGACAAFLDFDDGTAATLVYNGYDHFDTDEFHAWVGEGGQDKEPRHGRTRRALGTNLTPGEEVAWKYSTGYGGADANRTLTGNRSLTGNRTLTPPAPLSLPRERGEVLIERSTGALHQPHFGVLVVSCERADLRPSVNGVLIYDAAGQREVPIPHGRSGVPGRGETLDELYAAVVEGRPVFHNARWAKATLAVCLAIQQSARERREVVVEHQVATPDGVLK